MITSLLNSIGSIYCVSPEAAQTYEKAADHLIGQVNRELTANPEIHKLIGGNTLALMQNNHSNHAAFMTTVFKIGSYELLAKTVPWVYRAYRARGFSYDYFPVELGAWKRVVEACLAADHAAEIIKVYDWMISCHEDMIILSASGEGLTFSLPQETSEMQEILLSLMLEGDSRGCLQLASQSVQTIADLKHFYLDVVCPVMYRLGLLWEKNNISVAEEHVATAIVGRITANLYSRFASVDAYRGKVVVTSGPNELHEVGARMLADFLEMEGWDAMYLGANTPGDEILTIIKHHKPFLVAMSVSAVFNLDYARQVIQKIKGDPDTRDIKIMVGGLAFNGMPQLWHDIGADGYAADANNGALTANTWWEQRSA
jgi:methanogenic corrinoid protein MtbC1